MSKSEKTGDRHPDAPEEATLREVSSRTLDTAQRLARVKRLAKVRAQHAKLLQELQSEQVQKRSADTKGEVNPLEESARKMAVLQRVARAKNRASRSAKHVELLQKALSREAKEMQRTASEDAAYAKALAQKIEETHRLARSHTLEKMRVQQAKVALLMKQMKEMNEEALRQYEAISASQRAMLVAAATHGENLEPAGPLAGSIAKLRAIAKDRKGRHRA